MRFTPFALAVCLAACGSPAKQDPARSIDPGPPPCGIPSSAENPWPCGEPKSPDADARPAPGSSNVKEAPEQPSPADTTLEAAHQEPVSTPPVSTAPVQKEGPSAQEVGPDYESEWDRPDYCGTPGCGHDDKDQMPAKESKLGQP